MVEDKVKVGVIGEAEVEVSDLEVGRDLDTVPEGVDFVGVDPEWGDPDRVLVSDNPAIINHHRGRRSRNRRSRVNRFTGSMGSMCERCMKIVIKPSLLPILERVV